MGLITWAKKVIGMIFKRQAEEDFNVESVVSPEMESKIAECANIYRGTPYWVNADDNVKTINFAKAICSETARLATLGARGRNGSRSRLIRYISRFATG